MSTLEKTINLLQEMPEHTLESLYDFIYSIWIRQDNKVKQPENIFIPTEKDVDSIIGIAHEYANPKLIPLEKEAFANAMAEKHAIN